MRMIAITALAMGVSGAAWAAPGERTPCVAFNAASINAAEVARISAEAVADAQNELMRHDLETRVRTEAALDRFERADLFHRIGERRYRMYSGRELTPAEEARIEAQVEAALERAAAHESRARAYAGRALTPEEEARPEARIEAAVERAATASARVAEVMAQVEARMADIEIRQGLAHAELSAAQEARIEAALEQAEAAVERAAEAMERAQERRYERLEGGRED